MNIFKYQMVKHLKMAEKEIMFVTHILQQIALRPAKPAQHLTQRKKAKKEK
jgi:hypothetical protein